MTGTSNEITLKTLNDNLQQVLDRLSEIEMILNNPMHGIDMPDGVDMNINPTGISFDGNYVDSAGNNLAFNTNPEYNISSVDVKFDSLIDFDEGIQLNLNLDGDNK